MAKIRKRKTRIVRRKKGLKKEYLEVLKRESLLLIGI